MSNKCSSCKLVNFPAVTTCARCGIDLTTSVVVGERQKKSGGFFIRAIVCGCVCLVALLGFYLSLVISASSLTLEQKTTVRRATNLLREKGFSDEAFFLDNLTVYRGNDNWLNASVAKENAYAATNFPFEIMTLYSDFFTYPVDDTERAAILLHEAEHLKGKNEHDAYEFVWKHRKQLGWTKENYVHSPVWQNVRNQTKEDAPNLFVCPGNELNDCTE